MGLASFLNGGTVSQLRGAAFLALSDTGQVGGGSITDDAGGGGTVSYTYGAAVPCRIDPLAGDERVVGARVSERSTHLLTLAPWTPINASDRFQVAGRGTFEVTAVREQTAEPLRFVELVEVS
jgi:hypothetical protein